MLVGITYLMTSVTLALITLCIRSSDDQAMSDVDTFRYGVGWAKAMLFIAPLPVGVFAILFILARPEPLDWRVAAVAVPPICISGALLYGYRYVKNFCIHATDVGLTIRAAWTTRCINYNSIRKVALLHGGRGVNVLVLYGDRNKRLLRLTDSLSDLDSLCDLVRMRAGRFGAIYKERDKWGKWS